MPSKRLLREAAQAQETRQSIKHVFFTPSHPCDDSILLSPYPFTSTSPQDLHLWKAVLRGPPGTPFHGGWFLIRIAVPLAYPVQPPKMWFETKIIHPNIHLESGEVCLDVLKTQWSSAWTLESSLRAVQVMLGNPDADSPLNCDAGNLIRTGDVMGYESLARMFVEEHAKDTSAMRKYF